MSVNTHFNNGSAPADIIAIINTNIIGFEDVFGISFIDALLVTQTLPQFISKLNDNFDEIDTLSGVTTTAIPSSGSGLTIRNAINNRFDELITSSEFLNYSSALRASTTYDGAISHDTIKLTITSGAKITISWGDGTYTEVTGTGAEQSITSAYTVTPSVNQIRIVGDVDEIITIKMTANNSVVYEGDSFKYLTKLTTLYLVNGGAFYHVTGNLNCPSLDYLYTEGVGVNGDLTDTGFPNLTKLYVYNQNLFDIDFTNLPSKLEYFFMQAAEGDITNNSINSLPAGLIWLSLLGSSFDITGDFANAPDTLQLIDIQDCDFVKFKLSLNDLPSSLYHICIGIVHEDAEWDGDISDLSSFPNFKSFDVIGTCPLVTGDIDDLPSWFEQFVVTGFTGISGTLAGYPRTLYDLRITDCGNGITGGLEDVSVNTTTFWMINNTSFTYDEGAVPNFTRIERFTIHNSWSTAKVDACLIALAATTSALGLTYHIINLAGNNQARSAASDAAVANLQGRGFTVITN